MKSILLNLLFVFIFSNLVFSQSTISSTPEGGNWGDTLTWVGHKIPTAEDNVIISGPVFLYNISAGAKCYNLTVNSELAGSYILDVHGNLENNYIIKAYSEDLYFHLNIYGDLINKGNWDLHSSTTVNLKSEDSTNPQTHNISCPNGDYISANRLLIYNDNKIITTSDVYIKDTQILYNKEDIQYLDFKLKDYSSVTLENCKLNGININGHEALLNLYKNSKLEFCTVSNSITTYTNKAEIQSTEFTSDSPLINNDTLWIWGGASSPTIVSQNFENYGTVTNTSFFHIKNEFINKSNFYGSAILSGDSTQGFWSDGVFEGRLFGSGIIQGTAVFNNAQIRGNFKIPLNGLLDIRGQSIVSDTISGVPYGSYIKSDSTVGFGRTVLIDVVLEGEINFHYADDNELHGIVKNLGKISGSFRSYGLLINEGEILPYNIYFHNDFVNYGIISEDNATWTSINFTGNVDQYIDLRNGTSLTHSNIRFHPEINGNEYTWYKDDLVQNSYRELFFDTLSIDNAGTYYCVVDGQQMHNIIVGTGLVTEVEEENIDVDKNIPSDFVLEQNYPNPFNPSTTINFTIPTKETGHAQSKRTTLKIYDVLGNEISTLINEQKSGGNYSITFNASSLPSGVYFYRLESGNFTSTKKMILLK